MMRNTIWKRSMRTAGLLASMLIVGMVGPAAAQAWPQRTVTIITPSPPGDGSDIVARLVADKLQQRLGQSFVVENRTGAGGVVGTTVAANAAPDGYTFVMGNAGSHGINGAVYSNLPYDIEKNFSPVMLIFRAPNIFVAHPGSGLKTIQDIVGKMRSDPGQIRFGSGGKGSSAHMSSELLKQMAGNVQAVHVPYRGATPALTAVSTGEVTFMAVNLPPAVAMAKDGRVQPIAVTTRERSPALPNVPTVAESGYPEFETVAWFGMLAPAGTPAPILAAMERELAAVCAMPDIKARLENLGGDAACIGAKPFGELISRDLKRWRTVAQGAGIVLD